MKSLKELYKIGYGPSSSHTIGPEKIAEYIKGKFPNHYFSVRLYGSLASTGEGHGTDRVLKQVFGKNTEIIFDKEKNDIPHPNTLDVNVLDNGNVTISFKIKKILREKTTDRYTFECVKNDTLLRLIMIFNFY